VQAVKDFTAQHKQEKA